MVSKGKLLRAGPMYILLPYLPGGFEVYFTNSTDDPDRMKEVAKAHQELFKMGMPLELSAGKYTVYRVIPAIEPTEKFIEVNEKCHMKF